MKSIFLISLALFAHPFWGAGQDILPGGVTGIKAWYTAGYMPDGTVCWQNKLNPTQQGPVQKKKATTDRLNFNTVYSLDGSGEGFTLALEENDYTRSSIFTVYQPADSLGEKCVWAMSENATRQLMLTTKKLVDLRDSTNITFAPGRDDYPVISTYFQCKNRDSIRLGRQYLHIGGAFEINNPGIAPFRGNLAEIIVFDRFLSGAEKQKVESYLAIKYGIPVAQHFRPTAYLNAMGDTIWDARKDKKMYSNITGIGRDDVSGLMQPKSTCSYHPGLLTIGVSGNPAQLEQNSFLIWTDNNEDLETAPAAQGHPAHLSRRWLATATGNIAGVSTALQFDTRQAENQPAPGETWWLCIDRSGTGKFPLGEVDYYQTDSISPAGIAFFDRVYWDTDRSGHDLFTFGAGPAMMAKVWATAPLCSPPASGTFHLGAEGGRPPYQFSLRGPGAGFDWRWETTGNAVTDISGLVPGDYWLTIRDAGNAFREEHLYLESADAPVSYLAPTYSLLPGQTLRLDASKDMPPGHFSYRWEGPDGFLQETPDVGITKPGIYRLIIDHEGCLSRRDITVGRFSANNFKHLQLYPNPVGRANPVEILIQLYRDAAVDLQITDLSSRVLVRRTLQGNNFYRLTENPDLPAGMYLLTFTSEQSVQTLKLVVE